ncbi:MAG TPA: DUF4233 domain-containing protein [Pseudonocardiaceae bacterium]|jgi:hypothetical protein|nr:DUF4233 domain-containing protein [Pseudonocardiaceae bacterium]
MKGFRGVMAGTLVLEAIVVALGLLVVANLYGGLGTVVGLAVGVVALGLLVCCGLLRRGWSVIVVLALQAVLIGCVAVAVPIGVIGLVFAGVWGYLLWLRREVNRRMAEGRLPGQQPNGQS